MIHRDRADLVVFVTDGDPNTINGPPGTGTTTFTSSRSPSTESSPR